MKTKINQLTVWMPLALLAVVAALSAGQAQTEPPQADEFGSIWAKLFPETLQVKEDEPERYERLSPMLKQFYTAAGNKKLRKATRLWHRFQVDHGPTDGEFEDAIQERLSKWAHLELERCRHLAAKDTEAVAKSEEALQKAASEAAGEPPFPEKTTS